MKNIINLYILFILVAACTEPIDLELNEGDNEKLVVDAWLTNEVGTSQVNLSLSTSYFNPENAPTVTDAQVVIIDGTTTIPLSHTTEGTYKAPDNYKGTVGNTYELQITHKEKQYTAVATMNRVPAIDSIDYVYDAEDEEYEILLYSQEIAGEGDHYLFKTIGSINHKENILSDTEFVDDEFVDGNYIDGASIGYGEFEVGETVTLEMWSISEETYDFFTAVSLETAWRGGIFDTPPANTPTNLTGGALGFFNASAVSRNTVKIEE